MKKVIITGGSDGLGLETAKLIADKGIPVISISRSQPKDTRILHLPTDLTKEQEIENATKEIIKHHNDFDVLINCAGMINLKPLDKLSYTETENLFKLNVIAPVMLVSQLLEMIKGNNADIVNVGSTVGFKAYKDQAAYGASKWGLRGFNENLRLELKNTGVRVIGFMPGGFKSSFVQKYTGDENVDLSAYMEPEHLAKLLMQVIETPKGLEVSEIIINRKVV